MTLAAAAIAAVGMIACGPGLDVPPVAEETATKLPEPTPTVTAQSPTPTASPTATPTPMPAPTPTPTQTPDGPAEQTPVTDTLSLGDEGEAVVRLQDRLTSLGYWLGHEDGVFGRLTEQAVFAFQGWEGLARDGIVGESTRAALSSAERPVPSADDGDLVEVHRDEQVLLAVQDGSTRWALHVSTGTGEPYQHPDGHEAIADTPAGTWTISWQVDGWRNGDLGRMYRPKYFHVDGLAIHGYGSVPADPASHGCVRVTLAAMDLLWADDLAPENSTVVVH